jgi:hypothetical protein
MNGQTTANVVFQIKIEFLVFNIICLGIKNIVEGI